MTTGTAPVIAQTNGFSAKLPTVSAGCGRSMTRTAAPARPTPTARLRPRMLFDTSRVVRHRPVGPDVEQAQHAQGRVGAVGPRHRCERVADASETPREPAGEVIITVLRGAKVIGLRPTMAAGAQDALRSDFADPQSYPEEPAYHTQHSPPDRLHTMGLSTVRNMAWTGRLAVDTICDTKGGKPQSVIGARPWGNRICLPSIQSETSLPRLMSRTHMQRTSRSQVSPNSVCMTRG